MLTHLCYFIMLTLHTTHAHPIHTHTQDGIFPLFVASDKGHDEIAEMLLQAGARVDLQTKVEKFSTFFICQL